MAIASFPGLPRLGFLQYTAIKIRSRGRPGNEASVATRDCTAVWGPDLISPHISAADTAPLLQEWCDAAGFLQSQSVAVDNLKDQVSISFRQ